MGLIERIDEWIEEQRNQGKTNKEMNNTHFIAGKDKVAILKQSGRGFNVEVLYPPHTVDFTEEERGKVIINEVTGPFKCLLEVDGKYFGYDVPARDPYPESLFKEKKDAYVFENPQSAFDSSLSINGKLFKIIYAGGDK